MAGVYDPATLFNLATLHLHVPPAPPQHGAPPSTSLLNSGLSADEVELQEQETDAWVSAIVRAEEREQAYYDETLPFYLLIRLPSAHPTPPLNRAQAASFLLPSLQAQHGSQPHLALSADVSYIEGAPTPAQATGFQTTPSAAAISHQKRNFISSSSALGRGPPPSSSALPARRGSLPSLDLVGSSTSIAGAGPKVPLTPSPFPFTRANDSQYASTEGVSLWSYVFGSGAGPDSREKGKGKQGGRVWVGREQVEGGGCEGDWIGVWEFGGDVAFVRTSLTSPRLCLTITATLRDDPRLTDLLERVRTPTSHSRSPSGVNGVGKTLEELRAEDEYLVESFDDVNLLSSLSGAFPSSQPLHLPASRLPLPTTTSNTTPSHPRRASRTSISLPPGSLPPVAADAPLHPSIRRAVRRVLNVKSALNVRMRTVPCSVEGLGRRKGASNEEDLGGGIGMEGGVGGEGLIMCVEVEGGSTSPDASPAGDQEDAFEIESVSVEMTNGSSTSSYVGDVEIREVLGERTSTTFPLLLGAQEQHNFLYAVTFSSEAAQLASLHHSASLDFNGQPPSFEPVPIGVATSPSQRFTARFGEEPTEEQKLKEAEKQRETERAQQGKESPWLRGVVIVVKGRPVRVSGGRRGVESTRSEGRSLMSGYSVDDAAPSPTVGGEPTTISPTDPFSSRWNCTLDISPFAQRSPPKRASFNPPAPVRPTSTLSAAALARLSISSAPFPASPASKRSYRADMPQVEAVAGSKRHTMASLASLASKSPVLVQRGFKRGDSDRPHLSLGPLPPRLTGDARALPPTPFDVQTPGATGPPRRFFSLPPGAGNESPYNTPGQHQSFSSLASPSPLPPSHASHANLPPTPAYPPHPSARNSLPHVDPLNRRFDGVSNSDPRRESWNTATMAPGFDHGVGRGRDWNVSPSNSIGLGFDGTGAGVPTDADLDQIVGGRGRETRAASGNIVVSISLIPLRTVKSQRPPPVNSSLTFGSDSLSLSSPEVDLHAGRLSPHATFQFPSAPSSPNPSQSPDPSSTDISAAPTPPPFITERRRSSSMYPSPAPAPKAKAPRPRAPRIGLLDVFLVEVFIVNRGDEVKRFTVGVPVKRLGEVEVPAKGDLGIAPRGLEAGLTAEGKKREERVAKIVALENDVRIGPLAPNTCASVRLRFLAIRPGAHTLDELRLVDIGTGLETRLRNPLSVVVEG